MIALGQLCLLTAMVGSGYAAFAEMAAAYGAHGRLRRAAAAAGFVTALGLSMASATLAWALAAKDFRFAYVTQSVSRALPWYYALSAFWVGQEGSLLLWTWLLVLVAAAYRYSSRRADSPWRGTASGLIMAYVCSLTVAMVFAANPMQASLSIPPEGEGLSPLLQHPMMVMHPPVVFLGYAGWAVPLAIATAAAIHGRYDAAWVREARPWAIFSWAALGVGILLGASWAYEELGWGGYWSWDPVENGSLVPWLTGTAAIHAMLGWQYRGLFKRSALALLATTFVACNLAAFLTRSGVFSSLHAFNQSPIGWMFLALVAPVVLAMPAILVWRRKGLAPEHAVGALVSREAALGISLLALALLGAAIMLGTWSVPLSDALLGRKIVVGAAFFNGAAIPTSLALLTTLAAVPLLPWGSPPSPKQRRLLLVSILCGVIVAMAAYGFGQRKALVLIVLVFSAAAMASILGAWYLRSNQPLGPRVIASLIEPLGARRRAFATNMIHLGFASLLIGVVGSSLGTRQHDGTLCRGETLQWNDYVVDFKRLAEHRQPEKLVLAAELEIHGPGGDHFMLRPAQYFHQLQNQWTGEVAIHSSWLADFYAILHSGEGEERIRLTCIENPMMRWLWLGGWLSAGGALVALWPSKSVPTTTIA